jgi:purine-nucleoside phosphorylase
VSFHLEAKQNDIAEVVLLPGDPLRAKYIAENFLDEAFCYNNVRGMLGYTGIYHGKRVSVQSTGMGVPSISIYVNELLREYGVKNLIRIGTCCSIQDNIKIRDLVLAVSASSNSSLNTIFFESGYFAPTADFNLLQKSYNIALKTGKNIFAGNVLTSDVFYNIDNQEYWRNWANYGVLALEMETSGLYTIASRYGAKAISILTVSDSFYGDHELSSLEKERDLNDMIKIALELS